MPVPQLSPASTTSTSILTATGSTDDVAAALPFTVYSTSAPFISGAADQVAYVYKKLGGDVLDIEIKTFQTLVLLTLAVWQREFPQKQEWVEL